LKGRGLPQRDAFGMAGDVNKAKDAILDFDAFALNPHSSLTY